MMLYGRNVLFLQLICIFNFANSKPVLRSRHSKGTAIAMLKYRDILHGSKVAAAADRMMNFYHPKMFILKDHWQKMAERGLMNAEKLDKLDLLTLEKWRLIRSEPSERKIQYLRLAGDDGGGHAAVGFSGLSGAHSNFRNLINGGAEPPKTMQDVAQMVDKAYRDSELELDLPAERRFFLATDGVEIYNLNVGGRTRPVATKMEGNLHVDGFGEEEIHNRLGPIYDEPILPPITIHKEEVKKHLRGTFAAILNVDPNMPHRPFNPVSASFDALLMDGDPSRVEMYSHEDSKEVRRIRDKAPLSLDTVVEDIVKEGGWDGSFNQDPELGAAYERAMRRLQRDQWDRGRPNPRDRGHRGGGGKCQVQYAGIGQRRDGGNGGGGCGSFSALLGSQKSAARQNPRNGKPPPTPSKETPKNRLIKGGKTFGKKMDQSSRHANLKPQKTMNFKKRNIGRIGKGRRLGEWGIGRRLRG